MSSWGFIRSRNIDRTSSGPRGGRSAGVNVLKRGLSKRNDIKNLPGVLEGSTRERRTFLKKEGWGSGSECVNRVNSGVGVQNEVKGYFGTHLRLI